MRALHVEQKQNWWICKHLNGRTDQISRLRICEWTEIIFLNFYAKSIFDMMLRQISHYSTAATDEAAYILGGFDGSTYTRIIAEYRNQQWKRVGDLTQARYAHGSISIGQKTMVVGGYTTGS